MDILGFVKERGVKGAVFDMDGTLTDSMSEWPRIYKILSDCIGRPLPSDFLMKYNHLSMRSRAEYASDGDADVYRKWLDGAVKFYENEFRIKPYMLEALKGLCALGVKCAVATASDRACAEAFIKSNNIGGYIGGITSLDDVARPKSFPDIYLKAAAKLGVEPSQCLVFEDALTAIKAAKSGGFLVCGVRDGCSSGDEAAIKSASDITLGFGP